MGICQLTSIASKTVLTYIYLSPSFSEAIETDEYVSVNEVCFCLGDCEQALKCQNSKLLVLNRNRNEQNQQTVELSLVCVC